MNKEQKKAEIFVPILDFDDYEVSNCGTIKSKSRSSTRIVNGNIRISLLKERFLKPSKTAHGYLTVCLWKNGFRYTKTVHRIVATAFILNDKNKPIINHKNGVKTDNHVDNLEWCTYSENLRHALDTGLMGVGSKRYNSKLTENDIYYIIKLSTLGVKSFFIAEIFEVSPSAIYMILSGKQWKRAQSLLNEKID